MRLQERVTDVANATPLEILSTIMMGVAFIGSAAGFAWLAWKYRTYRRPLADGTKPNGTAQLIFAQSALMYVALGLLSGLIFALSIMALFAPPPIRSETQRQTTMITNVFIGLSVLVDLCVLLNLWLTTRIDKAIRNEAAKKWDGHERRTPPEGDKV